MELDIRAIHDMSAVAAQMKVTHADGNVCMPPFPIMPHVFQSDAGIQAFMNWQQPVYPMTPHGQVMTDEQLETLRRQISVYATICQQLVEMHKAIMAQQSSASGLWLGQSTPFDSSLHSMGHKLTSRQRWTPSQTQLQILERLFEQESGTPNKQRIKEITIELSQHGQISETNVYNWFQNRRARTKRKQQLGGSNNGESELDTDVDWPEEKKCKTEREVSNDSLDAAHMGRVFQCVDSAERHYGLLDNTAVSYRRAVTDGRGVSEAGHLIDHKLWDIPLSGTESKADFAGRSVSQEFQGQLMIVNCAESRH